MIFTVVCCFDINHIIMWSLWSLQVIAAAAAAADLDPRPHRDVSTHPSSEKIYATLLPRFLGIWPDATSACMSGWRQIVHARVAPSSCMAVPFFAFQTVTLCFVYLCVSTKYMLPTHMQMCVSWLQSLSHDVFKRGNLSKTGNKWLKVESLWFLGNGNVHILSQQDTSIIHNIMTTDKQSE